MKHTIKDNSLYFMTFTVVGWTDVFTRPSYKELVIKSLKYCIVHKGLNVYGYCLMTNHLHLMANCNYPYSLAQTIRDFKRYVARTILTNMLSYRESRRIHFLSLFKQYADYYFDKGSTFKFWKPGTHAIKIYSKKFIRQKLNYIHMNPVAMNFVRRPEHWVYSSASNYAGMDSALEEVTLADNVSQELNDNVNQEFNS